ncbi:F-box/kelch-repeat protein At3g23880-like [Lycium barbarum]|uniref:F-box/kelch-repeat protein At3g23880-like n=1 Tax=Lycium barbarum TaxID=112863 RepID=UPI00293F60D1|nr:F-box/kelch-repeat protein At3g23880-like [Lycium barbarum]
MDYRPNKTDKKWPQSGVNLCNWNPSIRKYKKLPESGVKSRPTCSRYFRYGFGYDELHDDYILVVIFNMFDDNPKYKTNIKIYSLKNDSWRTVRDFLEGSVIDCSAKFVKGKLYWTSALGTISFNLANEKWDTVEQPDYGKGNFDLMLGVLGSDLVELFKMSELSLRLSNNGVTTMAVWREGER